LQRRLACADRKVKSTKGGGITLLHKTHPNMVAKIEYRTDSTGRRTSVSVPIEEWKRRNARIRRLQVKVRILTGIHNGLLEVKAARQSGQKLQKLSDFIHESRG
jgi:hypothetical protein